MTNKMNRPRRVVAETDPVEDLYHRLLDAFYGDQDYGKSERVAKRLEKALADSPDDAESIRAEEIRSLIAEIRGNLPEAIRSREAEVRKLFELHSMNINTPHWDYVFSIYNFSDISDRLDLLAILYDEHGELDRAIAVLEESKLFCQAHQIPFDGQDILDELEEARRTGGNGSKPTRKRPRRKSSPLASAKRRNGAATRRRRSA